MKKTGVLSFLAILMLLPSLAGAAGKDFIVLLDTSESMFDYYDQVVEVFMTDVLKKHLRAKDDFHLITFAQTPEIEIVKNIERPSDAEPILQRLLVLQPLGKSTDLLGALTYLDNYATGLSPNLGKTIVILSDGIHNPPQGQSLSPEETQRRVTQSLKEMTDKKWNVIFIRVPPLSPSASREAGPIQSGPDQVLDLDQVGNGSRVPVVDYNSSQDFSNQALGAPRVSFPQTLGPVGSKFTLPLKFESFSDQHINLRIAQVLYMGQNVLDKPQSIGLGSKSETTVNLGLKFTAKPKEGPGSGEFTLVFEDGARAFPSSAPLSWNFDPKLDYNFDWVWTVLSILGVAALLGLVWFFLRLIFKTGQHLAEQGGTVREKRAASLGVQKEEKKSSKTPAAVLVAPQTKPESVPVKGKALDKVTGKKESNQSIKDSPGKKEEIKENSVEPKATKAERKTIKEELAALLPTAVQGITTASVLPINHGAPQPFLQRIKADKGSRTFFLDVWTLDQVHQNTSSLANVITMKPGDIKSMGPGGSAFKIFLRPLKKPVAQILFDGQELSLKPLGNNFPDIKHEELYSCTDKVLRLVWNERGDVLLLKFSLFISKTDEYNRSIQGVPLAKRTPF